MASAPLDQQPGDDGGLKQQSSQPTGDGPPVVFPRSGSAKENLAPGRQPSFTDLPSLQFPPVELRCAGLDWRRCDLARRLSVQNAQGSAGRLLPGGRNGNEWTPNDPLSQKDVAVAEDRRARDRAKTGHRLAFFMRDPGCVDR